MPENPFDPVPNTDSPTSANPYAVSTTSPRIHADQTVPHRDLLRVPAIGLGITAMVGLGLIAAILVYFAVEAINSPMGLASISNMKADVLLQLVYLVVPISAILFILYGVRCMRKRTSYTMSLAAAIVSLVPFLGLCCIIGIPFGIWALIVLTKSEVRAEFSKQPKSVQGPN